jgi:8-oxo-dGTP diphosphatase
MEAYPRHIVAATGIVLDEHRRVLLVKTQLRGWEPPGGQIELGESLTEGVQREIAEESGCRAAVVRMFGVYSSIAPPEKVIFGFLCRYISGTPQPSDETSDAGWFSQDEALEMVTHPALLARLQDALSNRQGIIYRIYRSRPYRVLSEQII